MTDIQSLLTFAIVTAAFLAACYALYKAVVILLSYRYLINRTLCWLEIIPPGHSIISHNIDDLFGVLHSALYQRNIFKRICRQQPVLTLEVTGTKDSGIQYMLVIDEKHKPAVMQTIKAYMSTAKIKETVEPYHGLRLNSQSYGLHNHYAFPLNTSDPVLDTGDYLTAAMKNLESGETISLQLCAKPVKLRSTKRLRERILTNNHVVFKLQGKQYRLISALNRCLLAIPQLISELTTPQSTVKPDRQRYAKAREVGTKERPARILSEFESNAVRDIQAKLKLPLYSVAIRTVSAGVQQDHKNGMLYTGLEHQNTEYQQIRRKRQYIQLQKIYLNWLTKNRILLNSKSILSSHELGQLFGLKPRLESVEDSIRSLSRTLPVPLNVKNNKQCDIVLGKSNYHDQQLPIGLSAAERERHIYVVGGTGNGKTTMLQYAIIQDMQQGKGVAVIDPHGDLAENLLRYVPQERVQDVVYLNPDDLLHPIGINLLELQLGLEGDELLREKDLVTESAISVLRKIFSTDDTGGHRIEYILRNTIQTALTIEGATLFTIFRLLNDNKYRKGIVKQLDDQDLKNFWLNEVGKAGDMQKVKMSAGITAKIGRFLFSATARRILEQEKSSIDFEDVLDSGKILICNFSKGLLGEDTSALFGTTILAKLQLASLKRARQLQSERKPFFLYVDEFQNFATMSFVQMLSEARKYKLFLIMAEQSTSQQDEQRLVDIILANVGTVICFRSGSPADERYMLPLFQPYIQPGEIANLPSYNFYMRDAAVHSQEPLSGTTVLTDAVKSEANALAAIQYSRTAYAPVVDKIPNIKTESTAKPTKSPKTLLPDIELQIIE